MAGSSPGRADGHRPVADSLALHVAFHRMPPVERDRIVVACHEIEAGTLRLFQRKCALPAVLNAHGSCDDVKLRKHSVVEFNLQPEQIILQSDDKRLRAGAGITVCPVRIDSRKAGNGIQSVFQPPGIIAQVAVQRTVLIRNLEQYTPVIAISKVRILLREEVHRIRAVRFRLVRIPGKPPVLERQQEMHVAVRPAPVILMQKIAVAIYMHLVSRALCMQCKYQFFGINLN